ncbi:MAG: aspartyl protease family protein [Anaerolineae bacterium]
MPRYDDSLTPPAPFVDVVVIHPSDAGKAARRRGKLDTGADLSAIPEAVALQLQLPARGTVTGRDYKGEVTTHVAYTVALEIDGQRLDNVKVIATARNDVLLGRNVLNQFIITLNGKTLTFDIEDP